MTKRPLPHVVIVGGGLGGMAAARALRNSPVRVTLIDRLRLSDAASIEKTFQNLLE
jgi:2-polyprenyl-6-methoxyphenol hydroxylase-like FAD-dependent oxidoreductase